MHSKDTEISSKHSSDTVSDGEVSEGTGEQGNAEGAEKQREIGGRKGPDPTRYGDWEKAGRCIDF